MESFTKHGRVSVVRCKVVGYTFLSVKEDETKHCSTSVVIKKRTVVNSDAVKTVKTVVSLILLA